MKASGKKVLLVTGTLEIILGLLSILGIVILLMSKNNVPALSQDEATKALGGLLILYGVYGVNILGGLLGVIFADKPKHSALLMVCGFILILMQISTWSYVSLKLIDVIMNVIIILIPCYYFYGAVLNYKDYTAPAPRRKIAPSKAAVKTTVTKTASVKPKKTTPKKTTARKTATKKAETKKPTTTKKVERKPAAKKTTNKTTKKPATKKTTTTKKSSAKKTAPKKTTAKKTTTKKK